MIVDSNVSSLSLKFKCGFIGGQDNYLFGVRVCIIRVEWDMILLVIWASENSGTLSHIKMLIVNQH